MIVCTVCQKYSLDNKVINKYVYFNIEECPFCVIYHSLIPYDCSHFCAQCCIDNHINAKICILFYKKIEY